MTPDCLTAVYDLNVSPVAYDFITWLVRAKREQQRARAARLHVVILPKLDGLGGFARHWGGHDAAATYWRLWHIVLSACPLARATVTLSPTRDYVAAPPCWPPKDKAYFLGPLVQAARAGEHVPLLEPTEAALRWAKQWTANKRVVTLSIRRNADDGRDSNPSSWTAFASWLQSHGWEVMVLPDTVDTLSEDRGPLACIDIDLRAALYRSAVMNCFVNNGPLVLAWHSGAPFLGFNAALPVEPWRAHWEEYLCLQFGEQLPWATAQQRLIYQPDDLDIMMDAFIRCVEPD